jgi:hypothetical protein
VQPISTTEVAERCVVSVAGTVWCLGESAGMVSVSSPTIEKSADLACSRQFASTDLVRSTWMVAFAVVADVTSNRSSRDVTGGFDPTIAAHASHASPAAATTATTAMINGRRDRRPRPYRASRSAAELPSPLPPELGANASGPVAAWLLAAAAEVLLFGASVASSGVEGVVGVGSVKGCPEGVGRGGGPGLEDHCVL